MKVKGRGESEEELWVAEKVEGWARESEGGGRRGCGWRRER